MSPAYMRFHSVCGAVLVLLGLLCASRAVAVRPSLRWQVNAAAGTVLDKRTGLVWQRDSPTSGGSSGQTNGYFNWADAKQYCLDLVLAGQDDWRLPSLQELRSLVHRKRVSPAISTFAFPNTPKTDYVFSWSATPYAGSGFPSAWGIDSTTGHVITNLTGSKAVVRCVR